ncbi:MAG: CBS domain-containing protein, partial [Desulfobacteraceae bacterium]
FKTLHKNDSLDRAIELTLAGSQKDFPVLDNGRIEGVLTQSDLLKALSAREHHPTVTTAMQRRFATVDSLEMLESAFAKLKGCNCHTLPVMLNGQLAGLLTMDNVGEYMRIQSALRN